jgi:hypothetical protein
MLLGNESGWGGMRRKVLSAGANRYRETGSATLGNEGVTFRALGASSPSIPCFFEGRFAVGFKSRLELAMLCNLASI